MRIKSPKARHRRFLEKGFFPPEMPSCFYSETLARAQTPLLSIYNTIPLRPNKQKDPDYYYFKSERSIFTFPRFKREDRRHSYINPIAFFFLSKVLSDNYVTLRRLTKRSRLSIAPSIFDWSGERALTRSHFDARDTEIAQLNARFEFLAEADINAFYHSIYTHIIAWAIHGKAIAKKARRDYKLIGNVIDLLVRNAQDGQTIGLPVGPDTSRLIAEVVGTAIDRSIQDSLPSRKWKPQNRSATRFIDDFTFGCSSRQEADIVIATIRRSVNEFELELNNTKTKIIPTGPFYATDWREHVKAFVPKAPFDRATLARFFYDIGIAAKHNENADVVKFALQSARGVFLETSDWDVAQDYLLSAYRENPTIISLVVEIFIWRWLSKSDVSRDRLADFVSARIPTLIELQKFGEVSWFLFLCISLGISIKRSVVSELFSVEDAASAVLIRDAHRLGLIAGKIDRSLWNKSLTADGLTSPMWLYSYETTLKGLNGTSKSGHVSGHAYFGPLFAEKVEFYRSGPGHLDVGTVLRRLRLSNIRRLAQRAQIEKDLAESVDEFDEIEDEEFFEIDPY